MKKNLISLLIIITLLVCLLFLTMVVAGQSTQSGQKQDAKPASEQTVGQAYKNIQTLTDLKDSPQGELIAAMDFMAGSLSVGCDHCHVAVNGPYDSDAKKPKLIARDMIKMTRAINEANFSGRQVVTCNTCHQGNVHPSPVPRPWYRTPEQLTAYNKSIQPPAAGTTASTDVQPPQTSATLPDADQVLANYRKAVGVDGIKTLHLTGVNLIATNGEVPIEIDVVLPDKFLIQQNVRGSKILIGLNGSNGWAITPQGPVQMNAVQLSRIRDAAATYLPIKYSPAEVARKITGIERLDGRNCYLVQSQTGKKTERLYFDTESGLLLKIRNEIETVLGTSVNETTFEDYRDVNGVKMSYLIGNHFMGNQSFGRISTIQTNVSIDPSKFEKPQPQEQKPGKGNPDK